jgi:predicted GH43/DUF377 family glycosyl hydrolase
LLYKKKNNFFIKDLNNKSYTEKDRKIHIFNNFGFDISYKKLYEINITQIEGQLILSYKRDYNGQLVTAFADSEDGLNFNEDRIARNIKSKLIFLRKDHVNSNYLAYTGENFIYFASSDSLENWNIDNEHLLTPRQNFFDHEGIKVIEAIELKKESLLLYDASFSKNNSFCLQIGGAMIEKGNPKKVLWRSENPIWEQRFSADEKIGEVFPLGALVEGDNIFVYYSIDGELVSINIDISFFKNKKNKKLNIISRHEKNPIIAPKKENGWESKAVFNAAAIYADGKFHLIYRAVGDDDVSTFGYASSKDGFDFDKRLDFPVYIPREKFEGVLCERYKPCKNQAVYDSGGGCHGGCEDPRLTRIGDIIYMTYVAFNGRDVPGVAIASIKYDDFINNHWHWNKARLISKPGQIQKNWMLFPEKINGKFAIIHSISPKIMIDYFDSIDEEGVYIEKSFRRTDTDENRWDNIVRGAGAPQIKTKYGWLLFYHAMDKKDPDRYKIGAMILDYINPEKILYRSRSPVLEPDEHYENEGHKAGVIYVCGAIIKKDILYVYYGGADMVMCVASTKIDDFLEDLVSNKKVELKQINL